MSIYTDRMDMTNGRLQMESPAELVRCIADGQATRNHWTEFPGRPLAVYVGPAREATGPKTWRTTLYLSNINVDEAERQKGHFIRLLEDFEAACEAHGFSVTLVNPRPELLPLLARRGYRCPDVSGAVPYFGNYVWRPSGDLEVVRESTDDDTE